MDEAKLLIRIAEMYYQEDKNQSEISKALNIHRSTISRLLKRIREEGIVNITINYDISETYELESRLESTFGLKKAIIVPGATDGELEQKIDELGEAAADYLKSILSDKMNIGFSWGKNMAAVATAMDRDNNFQDLTCVPLIGGPSGKLSSDYHVNTITYQIAKKLGAQALLIDAPAIPETVELKDSLLENDFNQILAGLWKKLDIAVLGIGSPELSTNETWVQFYGAEVLDILKCGKAVGDVVSRFFNIEGETIDSELDKRVVGIAPQDLKKIDTRIGVVESIKKRDATIGAMRGEFINVLVTTESVAQAILST